MKQVQSELVMIMPFAKWAFITLNLAWSAVLVVDLLGWVELVQTSEGTPWLYRLLVLGALLTGIVFSICSVHLVWIAISIGLLLCSVLVYLPT